MEILDLRGPDFLKLYIPLTAVAVCVSLTLRYVLRSPAGAPSVKRKGSEARA